jgi:uncharacterized protein YndB with AHSA1/START domain
MRPHHETLVIERNLRATPDRIFRAYLDKEARQIWSAPSETAAVEIVTSDVRRGGLETTRCGTKGNLEYRTEVTYHEVLTNELICFSETLLEGDNVLMVALITFELRPVRAQETLLVLTDQITSFVGPDGVDGHRKGFSDALENLAATVSV